MSTISKCVICEEKKENGIQIIQAFICDECEKEIVMTETDAPMYNTFVEKLKTINSRIEEIVN